MLSSMSAAKAADRVLAWPARRLRANIVVEAQLPYNRLQRFSPSHVWPRLISAASRGTRPELFSVSRRDVLE